MPLSQYCKIYPLSDAPGQVMLFSTRTTAVVHVSREVLHDIEKGVLSPEEERTLSEEGFFTEAPEKERQELISYIDDLNKLTKTFTAVLVLNLSCNLACKYCFEGTRKGAFFMSAETADAFIGFLQSGVLDGKEEIELIFYGGEPLLSANMVYRITSEVRAFAEAQNIKFTFSLITNGTLLTRQLVEKLKPLGMRAASITLDGPREVHDAFRPFRSSQGSFDTIVRNIKEVCSLIDVQMGGNYTRDHFREFPRLLDYLLDTGGLTQADISVVRFDPVVNESRDMAPPDFHDGCMSYDEPWLREATVFLREEILKRGFRTHKVEPAVCFVERRSNVVVNYDGALYRCPGLIGRRDYCTGSVRSGSSDYRGTHNLDNWKNEECLACAYIPLCFGGCRYMKLVRDGHMQGVDCKKAYFDRTLEALVMQDVKYDKGDEL
ncbi:MAG TPA: geopeptide radical SAM maturase [Nitrospirota bacterium]|nr:geopeptide radical SAM maturase [Nitrospirota bacterium]